MKLPVWLRPWWPLFKRLHSAAALILGVVFRRVAPVVGERAVPRAAKPTSAQTAAAEPEAVTLHTGRAAVHLQRRSTEGSPAGHWVFDAADRATIPATFTLEVRDGRIAGDFGATITPSNRLDHETSTYFGVSGWRSHPLYLRPTLGRVEHVPGTVLSLTTRGTTSNYYHFLYDAIARLGVVAESLPDATWDAVVVPHQTRYQKALLDLVGIRGKLLEPRRGLTYRADRLLVPSNPNWHLDAPPSAVQWLRAKLPPSGPIDIPRRLYLTRGNLANTRRYVQEEQLWPELEKRGFHRLDAGSLTVQEQIDVFAQAEAIVAPHGAALTNMTFSPPGVKVLEMFPATYVHLGLWAIAQAIDADYRYLVADGVEEAGTLNKGIMDDVSIPPERVLGQVDALLD
jgi:capsular polysaccharide biosynthesis protein